MKKNIAILFIFLSSQLLSAPAIPKLSGPGGRIDNSNRLDRQRRLKNLKNQKIQQQLRKESAKKSKDNNSSLKSSIKTLTKATKKNFYRGVKNTNEVWEIKIKEELLRKKTAQKIEREKNAQKITVNKIKIKGDLGKFPVEYLEELLEENIGKSLSAKGLRDMLVPIKKLYASNGYVLTKVYFPIQDVTSGEITIGIKQGIVDKIIVADINNDAAKPLPLASKRYIKNIATHQMTPGEPLNSNKLQRALLLANDMGGVSVTSTLQKGKKEDTTTVKINSEETKRFEPKFRVDNTGNRYTGRTKLTAEATINNLFGYGSVYRGTATKSMGGGRYHFLSGDYSTPVGYDGLKLGLYFDWMEYQLGKAFDSLDSDGDSYTLKTYNEWPIYRSQRDNITLKSSLEKERSWDKVSGVAIDKTNTNVFSIGISADTLNQFFGRSNYMYIDLQLHEGKTDLLQQDAEMIDAASGGLGIDGDFTKYTVDTFIMQQLSEKLTWKFLNSAQWTNDNLDGGQKFQLGGMYGVRGFPSSEGTGDNGLLSTQELSYLLYEGAHLGKLEGTLFYDWGRIHRFADTSGVSYSGPNNYYLHSWGAGLNLITPYGLDVTLLYAQKISSNPMASDGNDSDGTDDDYRFWFTVNYKY